MALRLPAWPILRLRLFATVTIGSTGAVSFESVRHLALVAGFGWLSWLFPATLDAVAAYGMDLWVRRSPAAVPAKWLALSAIGGSLIANVADHYLAQRTVLPAVLGAVPPAMLAALLAVAHRHATGTADRVAGPDHTVRDAIWSTLAQAPRYRAPGPEFFVLPDRVLRLDRAAPVYGPPVGPLLAVPRVEYRAGSAVQIDGPVLEAVPDRPPVQRRRSSAARKVAGTTQRTARLHSDDEVRTWIREQTTRPTKQAVIDRFGMGSSKALRLINDEKGPISRG